MFNYRIAVDVLFQGICFIPTMGIITRCIMYISNQTFNNFRLLIIPIVISSMFVCLRALVVGFNLLTTPLLHLFTSPYIIRLELVPTAPLTHIRATLFTVTGGTRHIEVTHTLQFN
jgi:hypothetical protein